MYANRGSKCVIIRRNGHLYIEQGIDIISMCRLGPNLYTGSANGWIKVANIYDRLSTLISFLFSSAGPLPSTAQPHGMRMTESSYLRS